MTDKQPAARITPEDALDEAMARYPKTMAALARPASHAPGDGAWVPAEHLAEANRQIAAKDAEIARLTAEKERRDNNETRNCLNWGPCSRHDGRMSEASIIADKARATGADHD